MGLHVIREIESLNYGRCLGRLPCIPQFRKLQGEKGLSRLGKLYKVQLTDERKSVCDSARSGRPKAMPDNHYCYIDELLSMNDELTASDLAEQLTLKFGEVTYSERTVARARQDLGWTYSTARYCQAIREQNKMKRLAWCQERLEEGERFNDVIFTDGQPSS